MLDKLSTEDFTKHLNSFFYLSIDSGEQVEAELIEVTELGTSNAPVIGDKRRRPFSVIFSGPPQPVLPQGIYELKHAEMEPLSLFIVPIGPDKEGMRYEAVLN
ncbi:DUF6916 family protein [Chloroflexota bacterium]